MLTPDFIKYKDKKFAPIRKRLAVEIREVINSEKKGKDFARDRIFEEMRDIRAEYGLKQENSFKNASSIVREELSALAAGDTAMYVPPYLKWLWLSDKPLIEEVISSLFEVSPESLESPSIGSSVKWSEHKKKQIVDQVEADFENGLCNVKIDWGQATPSSATLICSVSTDAIYTNFEHEGFPYKFKIFCNELRIIVEPEGIDLERPFGAKSQETLGDFRVYYSFAFNPNDHWIVSVTSSFENDIIRGVFMNGEDGSFVAEKDKTKNNHSVSVKHDLHEGQLIIESVNSSYRDDVVSTKNECVKLILEEYLLKISKLKQVKSHYGEPADSRELKTHD